MAKKASVQEFIEQRNKLPGDREDIAAVGGYILELYKNPVGQRSRMAIEVNKVNSGGEYSKEKTVWVELSEAEEDVYEDLRQKADDMFSKMKISEAELYSFL
jgi:hypothetical protein